MGRLVRQSAADTAAAVAIVCAMTVAILSWRISGWAHARLDPQNAGGSASTLPMLTSSEAPKDKASPPPQTQRRTYNVILITVDTLRSDLGFMGYPRPVSANIDRLAARSIVFEQAYATASFTPKCLGPLMIGRYASETHRDFAHYTNFDPANVFLAERVHAGGGFTVGAASHRYFGWKKGFSQGFDVWDTTAIPPRSTDNDPTPTSEELSNVAIKHLTNPRTKPNFFAWFHYLDPHLPYVSHEGSPRFESAAGIPKERAPYDGEVWFTDRHIGRVLEHISAQPWANETAIIFTADHGEAFGERGHWGHGRELWEPLVHIPLVIHVPGVAPRRIKVKRSHIDVVPTVLDLMGLEPDSTLHGKSLLADTVTATPEERDVYIDMPDGPFNDLRRAVITGPSPGTKLIESDGHKYELFDLATDPGERKDLSADTALLKSAKEALTRARGRLTEIPPMR